MNGECSTCGRPWSSQLNHTRICPYRTPGQAVPVAVRIKSPITGVVHTFDYIHPESSELKVFLTALLGDVVE